MVTFTVLIPAKVQRLARLYFDWGGIAGLGGNLVNLLSRRRKFPQLGTTGELVDPRSGIVLGNGWGGLERVRGESFRRVHGSPELVLPPTAAETSVFVAPDRAGAAPSRFRPPAPEPTRRCGCLRHLPGARVGEAGGSAPPWENRGIPPGLRGSHRCVPSLPLRIGGCAGGAKRRKLAHRRAGVVCRSATLGHRTELVVTAPEGRLSPLFLSLRSAGDIPVALQVVDDAGVVVRPIRSPAR